MLQSLLSNQINMNRQYHLKTVFLGAFLLLLFAYVGGSLISRDRLADLQSELSVQVSEQRALLVTIAETTARNGADTATEKIITDCSISERTEFDALLDKLNNNLSKTELATLERLFGRCGSFYAERKSVMVARLEREVEVYEDFVNQLEKIDPRDIEEYKVSEWKLLVEDEKIQSTEFSALVNYQDTIIKSLLEGKSSESGEILSVLKSVKESQQVLQDASTTASERRKTLIAL
jgi:bisphosphoglycerate-independent phosphoglycerate mutase (AlkP superfamily)